MLVETTDFVNEIAIPIDMRGIKETKLCGFIQQYEPEWKRYALGYNFYLLFKTALEGTPDARWVLLRDGGDWTYNGDTYYFGGVRPLIRYYVYYHFMRSEETITTNQGEKKAKSENAADASAGHKASQMWNKMSRDMGGIYDIIDCLWGMLSCAEDGSGGKLFPEFNIDKVDRQRFTSINVLGI